MVSRHRTHRTVCVSLQEFYGDGLAECEHAQSVGTASSGGTPERGLQRTHTHTHTYMRTQRGRLP